jgi:hypothetical protein
MRCSCTQKQGAFCLPHERCDDVAYECDSRGLCGTPAIGLAGFFLGSAESCCHVRAALCGCRFIKQLCWLFSSSQLVGEGTQFSSRGVYQIAGSFVALVREHW